MDALDRWFKDMTSTPAGSVVVAALMLIARLTIDEWQRRRRHKKAHKHKRTTASG